MKIETTTINGYTKVKINIDRLDVAVMKEIKEDINKAIDDKHKVVLDLSMVNFLDSSGLSVLISVLKQVNKLDDASFKLCALNEQPNELMQITQLYNVFDIVDTCESI